MVVTPWFFDSEDHLHRGIKGRDAPLVEVTGGIEGKAVGSFRKLSLRSPAREAAVVVGGSSGYPAEGAVGLLPLELEVDTTRGTAYGGVEDMAADSAHPLFSSLSLSLSLSDRRVLDQALSIRRSRRRRVIFRCSPAATRSSLSRSDSKRSPRISNISSALFPVEETRKTKPFRSS